MKTRRDRIRKGLRFALVMIGFLIITNEASAFRYNRSNARRVINKTAFVINEAYEISNFYGYWSGSYLSKAAYYNDYAYRLMQRRNYYSAIHYSLRAREYALRVIDNCEYYWDYYYYTSFGWSRTYGRNPYYNPNHYPNHHYYGNYNNYYNSYYSSSTYGSNHSPYYYADRQSSTREGQGSQFRPNQGSSSGGVQTGVLVPEDSRGSGLKNISYESYFDNDEIGLLSSLPSDDNLEREFRDANKGVEFNDRELSKNTQIISRNRENAETFSRSLDTKTRESIKLIEPKKVDAEDIRQTRETRPADRLEKPTRQTGVENKAIDEQRVRPVRDLPIKGEMQARPTQTKQPTRVQPTQTQPTRTQPTQTQPTRTQPTKVEPTKTQPTRTTTQPTRTTTQPTRTQPTKTQPTKSSSSKTEVKSTSKSSSSSTTRTSSSSSRASSRTQSRR